MVLRGRRLAQVLLVCAAVAALLGGVLWYGQGTWTASPFDRVVPVGQDRLRVEWTGGTCDLGDEAVVEEVAEEVRVLVRRRVGRGACDAGGVARATEVRLDASLRDRRVLDAACTPRPVVDPGCR